MLKIALHHLKFHAFHGLYKEERSTGNDFEVNVDVFFNEPEEIITRLSDTIDYSVLYRIVKDRMNIAEPLLETLVMDMSRQIKKQFPETREINVSISKINPPIINFQGETTVVYNKKFDH
ncbi:MAG: dihydroneopterin aldolase [Chitinophagaceae bacterium]|nr:dihydroneopterin aldolase [Chitinophagaceae bacterium]